MHLGGRIFNGQTYINRACFPDPDWKKCDILLGVKDKLGEAHHFLHNFVGLQKID